MTAGFAFPKPERRVKKAKGFDRTKPARRIERETEEEKLHKSLIRQMRVCAVAKYAGAGPCTRNLQLAHLGPSGGTGAKHGDWTMSSMLCGDDPATGKKGHHQDLDQNRGIFAAMSADQLAAFKSNEIHLAREFVAGRLAVSR